MSDLALIDEDEARSRRRRDIARGAAEQRADMIRFVADPSGRVVADLAEKLPGRGVWIKSDAESLNRALKPAFLSRSLREKVTVEEGLNERIKTMLRQRLLDFLGLARRSGQLTMGFDQVQAVLRRGEAAILVTARDGSEGGKGKLIGLTGDAAIVELLDRDEIAAATGRDGVVHVAVAEGRIAQSIIRDATRLNNLVGKTPSRKQTERKGSRAKTASDNGTGQRTETVSSRTEVDIGQE